jgi:hypothetical protein
LDAQPLVPLNLILVVPPTAIDRTRNSDVGILLEHNFQFQGFINNNQCISHADVVAGVAGKRPAFLQR